METSSVNICYRPIRIAWAVSSAHPDGIRKSIRYSNVLWGGRFNPIVMVDSPNADNLIELFRPDVIFQSSDDSAIVDFVDKYKHIVNPLFHNKIFLPGGAHSNPFCEVLDIRNLLAYYQNTPHWKNVKKLKIKIFEWPDNDPLSDIFSIQYGSFPDANSIGLDYKKLIRESLGSKTIQIDKDSPIPKSLSEKFGSSVLSRYGLQTHYTMPGNYEFPGFYLGNSSNWNDIIHFWNIRACYQAVIFVDVENIERYRDILPEWVSYFENIIRNEDSSTGPKAIPIWSSIEHTDECFNVFSGTKILHIDPSNGYWNGLNIKSPMTYLDESSSLGVISSKYGNPDISFSLIDKPFASTNKFHTQHLIASLTFIGGLFGDDQHVLVPPYIPELTEFYGRAMQTHNDIKPEFERVGLVINTTKNTCRISSISTSKLIKEIFSLGNYVVELSNAGLIAKQIISKLGGLQGGRAFKIPGVRRLIKARGPNASFKKCEALHLIGSKDPSDPQAKFSDHYELYLQQRPIRTQLTPDDAFSYLVEKGLYRLGADVNCPSCNISSWYPLESLSPTLKCDLCDEKFDSTKSLYDSDQYHYRRSGILGLEKNVQGAIPVILTLQQLEANLSSLNESMYFPSIDVKLEDGTEFCEIDFIWISAGHRGKKTDILLAECKDAGHVPEQDIRNLISVANNLPQDRFTTFILISQILLFTDDQIDMIKKLKKEMDFNVILLSRDELEPYHIKSGEDDGLTWFSLEEMVKSTNHIYFG